MSSQRDRETNLLAAVVVTAAAAAAAACGAPHVTRNAVARDAHYRVPFDRALLVAGDVLARRYGLDDHPMPSGLVQSIWMCRTWAGAPCAAGGDQGAFHLQLAAQVEQTGDSVRVVASGRYADDRAHAIHRGDEPNPPAWVRHEIDALQVALDTEPALAGQRMEYRDPEGPAFKTTTPWSAQLRVETLPFGGFEYADDTGHHGIGSADTAFGVASAISYEIYDRIELGLEDRLIGGIRLEGSNEDSSTELDVMASLSIHTRPWRMLDLSLAYSLGYSHLFFPSGVTVPDPTGKVMDFAAAGAYPLSGDTWAVFHFGKQLGFQTTETELIPGMPSGADYRTDFAHVGVGIAQRF